MLTLLFAGIIVGPIAPIQPSIQAPPQPSQQLAQGVTEAHITAYANRLINESSFTDEVLAAQACTVRNRIRAGWHPDRVLSAYYAADGVATGEQVGVVRSVFTGQMDCDERWYYALSLQDTEYWLPHACEPLAVYQGPVERSQIFIFGKEC